MRKGSKSAADVSVLQGQGASTLLARRPSAFIAAVVSYARGTSIRICIVDVFLLRLIARTSVTDDWGTSSYAPINPRYTCAVLKVF